ncbi:MAG: hypothetical protein AAGJ28_23910 [Pseudomonadota bacterium]
MTRDQFFFGRPKFRLLEVISTFKKRRKELFWAWLAYQTIKGTATTALIWLPAAAYFLGSS